jgi:YVTN family beta-propeller protein
MLPTGTKTTRRGVAALLMLGTCVIGMVGALAQRGAVPVAWPGRQPNGATLLPNGWRIAPAGKNVMIGDLPLNMVLSPDGRFIVVTNNGWTKPTLTVFDTKNEAVVGRRMQLDNAWLGLAWSTDGKRLYAAGAAENSVYEFAWARGGLTEAGRIAIGQPERRTGGEFLNAGFVGGLAAAPDGKTLYAIQVFGQALSAIDLQSRKELKKVSLPAEPYTTVVSPDGRTVFVSLWGGARVLMFARDTLAPLGEVAVGPHPNAMVLSKDGTRLFVACANTNAVYVVEVATRTAREQISVALYPNAPVGSTPNALALSPDGDTLLVANADNNTVAVVDIEKPGASEVEGWVPVGWYPTAVMFSRDGSKFFVLNGKGTTSEANVRGPQPGGAREDGQYTGNMFQGTIAIVPTPDRGALAAMTRRVLALTPYKEATRLTPADAPIGNPIPRRVGGSSPIKHVFYVIRENRTYDQVLGDLARGNGDPSLTLFGEEVTPNAHAIAREFTLFDNFYVDAEVSYDGHAFSMGAYATDVVEKLWPTNYGGRGTPYLSEGGFNIRDQYGNFSAPPQGYIWDFAKRAGVSVRSYGEFASWTRPGGTVRADVPGLEGLVHPAFPPFDLAIQDQRRVDIWLEEFQKFERDGTLPQLSIIRIGNDHTRGTTRDAWTPRAMVADNDLALGRIVDAISHSRYWKESAIFVLEDDAQNGPDHVDAHRSILLAISPFSRRRTVDSTLYSTTAVLRTMELILGLPPMSQYDAAATPMYKAFQPVPDLTPYAKRPARVSLDEKNDWSAPGALASARMNFRDADRTPELELNQIIWQSVRGAGSVMPPPRRTGFVHSLEEDDER